MPLCPRWRPLGCAVPELAPRCGKVTVASKLAAPSAESGSDLEWSIMTRRIEASSTIAASAAEIFARLDDQSRLAEHMGRPTVMMGGGRMTYEFDDGKGQTIGSHIRMAGQAFGLNLYLDEVVTERDPPRSKVWQTVGATKLVIIGSYVMGFEIDPSPGGSQLRVWIDYTLPSRGPGRWMPAFAALYGRWCVEQMVKDAVTYFEARQ
jgi:hypothetical protein